MTIDEKGQELAEEFALFEDSMDKYEYIIELGKGLPPMNEALKTDDRIVKGCQSTVWLDATLEDGKVMFVADSNTVITKGIIAILIRILSEETPTAIAEHSFDFLDKVNLRAHLSSQRSNGLTAMMKLMKQYAQVFKLKEQQ